MANLGPENSLSNASAGAGCRPASVSHGAEGSASSFRRHPVASMIRRRWRIRFKVEKLRALSGERGRDRTRDPYHVKVALFRDVF
jgi:hypothetical protein